MDNYRAPNQLSFNVDGLHFAAQAWGNPQDFPVLALHGWLDNSASFFALGPQLENIYLVAIDMAGHGQTSHRLGFCPYNIWEDVAEIFAIADQLGWKKFGLLGHSRGGIIATLAAGTFPDRISRLGLIEGLLPERSRSEDAPQQLATSINAIQQQRKKNLTIYPNMVTAIQVREKGLFPLGHSAAKALTERGLKKIAEGYHWSTDQRLLAPSAVKLLPEQMFAFIRRINCPITLVMAQNGMPKMHPSYMSEVRQFAHINIVMLSGGHHLHMEQEVSDVASVFNSFFVQEK